MSATLTDTGIEVMGKPVHRQDEILTPEAVEFLGELHRRFAGARHERLADRQRRRYEIGNGRDPKFREDTRAIREDQSWRVAGPGPGLEDRRVEITGPTDPKMTINALNSGARVWLADQEDATSPTWQNVIGGQLSLFDAIRGQLSYTNPEGKRYEVTDAGRQSVEQWLLTPVTPAGDVQADIFAKTVIALMLDDDAGRFLDLQRAEHMARMRELTRLKQDGDLRTVLLADHALFHIEADLRWMETTAARLSELREEVRS